MLPRDSAHDLLVRALAEFAPEWEPATEVVEVTIRDPNHWLSGIGTFGATLRSRATGEIKVLGRRGAPDTATTYHRGISFLVLEAYAERNLDPIRRYLQEIGIAPPKAPARRLVFKAS